MTRKTILSNHMNLVTRALASILFLTITSSLLAQEPVNPALRPPKGASVAIVIFEDLECPDCRRAAPLVEEAAKTYKIPVVRHDFPLPFHLWSYDAAIMARYFDTHSKALGNQFRDYIFANQLEVTKDNLRGFAEKFATEHNIDLPFVLDPDGKLAALVNADKQLGKDINLQHTPTLYVVSNKRSGKPFVEVVDRSQLYALIDTMMHE
ncbi:MAG TPA: thioredoxin domain-containing protein [Candidatus Sulfotelmatobacter sp.]|nr:thioredoxin domain-containing protein [Candidatus Sulfotelmatobacter sp.]